MAHLLLTRLPTHTPYRKEEGNAKRNGQGESEEEEMDGLDYHEHGNAAYPNFQLIEKR